MSRLNLNSIIRWVDSYIIDYLKANKEIFLLGFICFISFFLLLVFSPILGMLWLLFPSAFFIYKSQYKNIFIIWGFFFSSWYFIFTACLLGFDGPILIKADFLGCGTKSEETSSLYFYIADKYLKHWSLDYKYRWYKHVLGNFCVQTCILLSLLSSKLGFSIYIPSILKGILSLLKFVFGGKGPSAQCSPAKKSDTSGASSSNSKNASTSVSVEDTCKELKKDMYKSMGLLSFFNTNSCVEGGRFICYGEAGIPLPFMDKLTVCMSRSATKSEIAIDKILKEAKK